jgi:hypothetical protein
MLQSCRDANCGWSIHTRPIGLTQQSPFPARLKVQAVLRPQGIQWQNVSFFGCPHHRSVATIVDRLTIGNARYGTPSLTWLRCPHAGPLD